MRLSAAAAKEEPLPEPNGHDLLQDDYRWAQKYIDKSEITLDDEKQFHIRAVGKRDEALRGIELKAVLKSTTQD
ncbi:MAG: hypothetical protein OXI01_11895 [Albidovulum sp.]|nr:hypothetical protein [Albidovulum sp.]